MPADYAARGDLDHHRMRLASEAPHASTDAPRRGRLALAAELDSSQRRSMTPAIAWPKPMHIVATPYRPPRRSSSFSSVAVIRAPVAPSGCPSEMPSRRLVDREQRADVRVRDLDRDDLVLEPSLVDRRHGAPVRLERERVQLFAREIPFLCDRLGGDPLRHDLPALRQLVREVASV